MTPQVLTVEQVREIHKEYGAKCRVCDEYHAHHAWCVMGPEEAILVCKLCETIMSLRRRMRGAVEVLDVEPDKEDSPRTEPSMGPIARSFMPKKFHRSSNDEIIQREGGVFI